MSNIKNFLIVAAIAAMSFTTACKAQTNEISTIVYKMNTINSGTIKIEVDCSSVSVIWGDGSEEETFMPNGKVALEHNFDLSHENRSIVIAAKNLSKFHLYGNSSAWEIIRSDSRIPEYQGFSDKELVINSIEKYYGAESIVFQNCNQLQEFGIGAFSMLKTLDCSGLPALEALFARHLDLLTDINISKNVNLAYLGLSDDVVPIAGINLNNNLQLQYLFTEDWICPVLDISKNTKLNFLYIEGTGILNQLILADNYPFLKKIYFEQSNFTAIQLNDLFNSLPIRKKSDFAQISLSEVLGYEKSTRSIATNKGWKFGELTEDGISEPNFFNDTYPCVNCSE